MWRRIAVSLALAAAGCTSGAGDARFAPPLAAPNATAGAAKEYIYALVTDGFSVYQPGSSTPVRGTIVPGLASAIACGSGGGLWLANSDFNAFIIFPPGGAPPGRTVIGSMSAPSDIALDASNDAFVVNHGNNTVTVFPSGAKKPSRIITDGLRLPSRIALDSVASAYVLNTQSPGSITQYAPRSKRLVRTVTVGLKHPYALIVDAKRTLYAGNLGKTIGTNDFTGSSVTEYAPNSTTVSRKIVKGINAPEALALDSSGSLYVANATGGSSAKGWISVYAPGTTVPSRTIQTGTDLPTALAFDKAGDLYVANVSNVDYGSITVYAPNSSKPLRRITNGVDSPLSLAICSK